MRVGGDDRPEAAGREIGLGSIRMDNPVLRKVPPGNLDQRTRGFDSDGPPAVGSKRRCNQAGTAGQVDELSRAGRRAEKPTRNGRGFGHVISSGPLKQLDVLLGIRVVRR